MTATKRLTNGILVKCICMCLFVILFSNQSVFGQLKVQSNGNVCIGTLIDHGGALVIDRSSSTLLRMKSEVSGDWANIVVTSVNKDKSKVYVVTKDGWNDT